MKRIQYLETSREAWDVWRGIPSDSADGKILAVLGVHRTMGLMCWEIESLTGLSHQTASGNLRHLVERGLVVRSERRGMTPSGRKAYYWCARWA